MRFTKIKCTAKSVELAWTTKKAGGDIESVEFESPEKPLGELPAALQKFVDYVGDLIDAPEQWDGEMVVTSLSISETKDGRRGLIVTATRKIEKASNRVLVINTPLMNARGENTSADATGIFDDSVLDAIAYAEECAARYHAGAREAQMDAFKAADGAPAEAVITATVPAEPSNDIAKARKKREKKPVDFVPGVGAVVNPEATAVPTDDPLLDQWKQAGGAPKLTDDAAQEVRAAVEASVS
jgi:hypothetical protein